MSIINSQRLQRKKEKGNSISLCFIYKNIIRYVGHNKRATHCHCDTYRILFTTQIVRLFFGIWYTWKGVSWGVWILRNGRKFFDDRLKILINSSRVTWACLLYRVSPSPTYPFTWHGRNYCVKEKSTFSTKLDNDLMSFSCELTPLLPYFLFRSG